MRIINQALLAFIIACAGGRVARAQTTATLTDVGATAPTPGAYDIAQLSVAGYEASPDSLNYYINNSPACGQTFTTGDSPTGYQLNSLAIRTAGGGGGGITTTPQAYDLWIYSVSGSNATLVARYVSQNTFVFTETHWLQWSGLALPLAPNSVYAYALRNTVTSSWESLDNAAGNPYAGGQLALIPPGGGTITFGASHGFDATFDLGLSVPAIPPHAVWETLVDGSSFNSVSAFTSQWSYDYPWGTDHNGSARMNATNVTVSGGIVTLTSSLTNAYEGASSEPPYLTIRYNSGTFYLNQQIIISPQYPVWDVSGQFKAPAQTGAWPAFWLTGVNSWPPESDIMEFKGVTACDQETYDGTWQGDTTTVSTAGSVWHSYRLVATLENSTNVDFHYYIDGVMETENTAATFVGSPCWLIIDYQMEGSSGSPGPDYTTYYYVTNIVVRRENVAAVTGGPVTNGVYKLLALSTGDSLDVLNQNTATHSPLGQWPYNAGLNEQWLLTHLGGGQYSLMSRQSGRALGVLGAATTNGAGADIEDYEQSNSQTWQLHTATNGCYELINVNSGKALEVSDNSAADAALVDQWSAAGAVPPQFGAAARLGTNLVLTGSGGVPGMNCAILNAATLTVPLPDWTIAATVLTDRSGHCAFTNALTPNLSQRYFRLQLGSAGGASNQQWNIQSP